MKAIIFLFIMCCLGFSSLCYFAYKCGQTNSKKEIIQRAKEINKECYTNQDIEKIIFNGVQL